MNQLNQLQEEIKAEKPIQPSPNTLAARCLQLLRERSSINSPEFQEETNSWRLAAVIHKLKSLHWPISSVMVPAPSATNPHREIARYFLSRSVDA